MIKLKFSKYSYRPYLALVLVLLMLLSLPQACSSRVREGSSALMYGPRIVLSSFHSMLFGFASKRLKKAEEKFQILLVENHLLKDKIEQLKGLQERESVLSKTLENLRLVDKDAIEFHQEELRNCLQAMLHSLPARVIYRDPAFWSHSLWINRGQKDNQGLEKPLIAKNSPVLLGYHVLGLVDYVGERQSRVRLITDPGLNPSVRAVRGFLQDLELKAHVDTIVEALMHRQDWSFSEQMQDALIEDFAILQEKLLQGKQSSFAAKGVMKGAVGAGSNILLGEGFNYDFDDEKGPAQDLATHGASLLKVNDLLITSGMDGVFPAGLFVGKVSKIFPLKEGAYSYKLHAALSAGSLDQLEQVFVISPQGFDPLDQPAF